MRDREKKSKKTRKRANDYGPPTPSDKRSWHQPSEVG